MGSGNESRAFLTALAAGRVPRGQRRQPGSVASRGWSGWLGEPRNAVFLVLASALIFGGGRRLVQGWKARRAVCRLGEPDVTIAEIEEASRHGRSGLIDLFRLLGTAESESLRDAAGRALAMLWAQDQLIIEEEKALVRRGFAVTWRARRRYPRALKSAIPLAVNFGVPFLREGVGVGPDNLEWSHRIAGARRVALESFTPWRVGAGHAEFSLIPEDFDTNGPHKLVLHTRVRTTGLTDAWELELPLMSLSFEFDPRLMTESLFALDDSARGEEITHAVQLEPIPANESREPRYVDLNETMALRDPPALSVLTPLPCDLAHDLEIEFQDVPGRFSAGTVVINGQGLSSSGPASTRTIPLGPLNSVPNDAFERPGTRRLRAILTPNPDLGWADPDVRSIWPGTTATRWVDVDIVRR